MIIGGHSFKLPLAVTQMVDLTSRATTVLVLGGNVEARKMAIHLHSIYLGC